MNSIVFYCWLQAATSCGQEKDGELGAGPIGNTSMVMCFQNGENFIECGEEEKVLLTTHSASSPAFTACHL